MKKVFLLILLILTLPVPLLAQNLTELVDIPTADIYESGTYNINLRVYGAGSVLTRLLFSVKFFELGAYLDVDNATGNLDPKAHDVQPLVKIRLYPGGQILPALAIGYEGQGENYYFKEPRGFYVVLSKEMLIPGLMLHLGGNNKDYTYGFAGLSYTFEEQGSVFVEYERIRNMNDLTNNKCNAGLKFQITQELGMEFDFKNIGNRGSEYERVLRFDYSGEF
ncbi:MAG: hypothetical protein PHD29_03435 [bacterium]|nr:hypothetical protein [bacterium]MDD5354164.1 hypothetical protein [bacterium]MDD5756988.1 hypothetical protein [bacterium]